MNQHCSSLALLFLLGSSWGDLLGLAMPSIVETAILETKALRDGLPLRVVCGKRVCVKYVCLRGEVPALEASPLIQLVHVHNNGDVKMIANVLWISLKKECFNRQALSGTLVMCCTLQRTYR